jgi:O-antigen ligase
MTLKLPDNPVPVLLAIALAMIPLPKGGMADGASLLFGCLVMLSLTLYLWKRSRVDEADTLNHADRPWLAVLIALSGWITIQLWIFPYIFGWSIFLPAGADASPLEPGPFNISETLHYWSIFCAYWVFAYLVSKLSRQECLLLLWVVTLSLCFQLIYGLLAHFAGSRTYLGIWERVHYIHSATGTFVNHNHYAGYLALCLPLVLSFFISSNGDGRANFPKAVRWIIAPLTSMFCLLALIASTSRMGVAVGVLGLSLWLWLFLRQKNRRTLSTRSRVAILLSMLVFLALVALWFGIEGMVDRFARLMVIEGRWELWGDALNFSWASWLTGVGAGAFADAYQLVQSPSAIFVAQEAHNDYLQFFLEFGLIGGGLVISSIIYWLVKLYPKGHSTLTMGAMVTIFVVALHSVVDFGLQIPGYAATFWLAVGLVMNPHLAKTRRSRSRKHSHRSHRSRRRMRINASGL